MGFGLKFRAQGSPVGKPMKSKQRSKYQKQTRIPSFYLNHPIYLY